MIFVRLLQIGNVSIHRVVITPQKLYTLYDILYNHVFKCFMTLLSKDMAVFPIGYFYKLTVLLTRLFPIAVNIPSAFIQGDK